MEKSVRYEYSDGSFLEAIVKGGQIIKCPVIKISPPAEQGEGSVTLDGAIEFLTDIKKIIK